MAHVAGAKVRSEGDLDGIRYAAGFIPAVVVLIAIVIMVRYPLTDARFHEIEDETRAHRAVKEVQA